MAKWVIVGLGNPGEEYTQTRHNAGRMAVEHFGAHIDVDEWKENKTANATVAKGEADGTSVELVLPNTYMNKSGSAVVKFVNPPAGGVKAAERLVVVYDELDLPLGKIKISFGRGSGGHKGVESIARALKTKDFVRIRVGVAKTTAKGVAKKLQDGDKVIDFILSSIRKPDMDELKKVFKTTDEALATIVSEGHGRAMNQFN